MSPSTPRRPTDTMPSWLKLPTAGGAAYAKVSRALHHCGLATVCEEARCPNRGECWGQGTATVLIMGDVCTRNCRFCSVTSGRPAPLDPDEPQRVATAAASLGLRYVVLTSVDRDDLPDGGAAHFAATVRALKTTIPGVLVEVLTPDFGGQESSLAAVLEARPDVFAHNIEVVRRLTPVMRDRRASYETSLDVLRTVARLSPGALTKSSLMVGVGETLAELTESFNDLRQAGVRMLTIGQYLRPRVAQAEVQRYYRPDEFAALDATARAHGFEFVAAGPLVRSSYRAGELFVAGKLAGV